MSAPAPAAPIDQLKELPLPVPPFSYARACLAALAA